MKTHPECIPCIEKLLVSGLQFSHLGEIDQQRILNLVLEDLSNADTALPPACLSGESYHKLLYEAKRRDIFRTYKQNSIKEALKLYPTLKEFISNAPDNLEAAIRVSALGNIIDIANPQAYDLEAELLELFRIEMEGGGLEIFRRRLSQADHLLILGDNAGETVFDRVLIENLPIPVIYAVKASPAFDDALISDAEQAGIPDVATLIHTGTQHPGTYLPSCSSAFRELFQDAPLILAKGQANYETLNEVDRELFFLLKVKCEVVSREINYPAGSLVFEVHP
jgi:uncharacterized protein with ATP-grasp and redox domains